MKLTNKKAFTLVELLVVIVLIALLCIIVSVTIFNILNKTYNSVEIQNTKILLKQMDEYLFSAEIAAQENLEQIYIIDDNKGYILNKLGVRERFKELDNQKNLCSYCVVVVNEDKQIEILSENKNQDVKKDFIANNVYSIPLEMSREDTSLYNELTLFAKWYIKNYKIEKTLRFISIDKTVYLLSDDGTRTKVFELHNSVSKKENKIKIDTSGNFIITLITEDNKIMVNNADGDMFEKDDINKEYSLEILNLFEELKYVAERYIANNNIVNEVYFEFNDGVINIIDSYGNIIKNDSVKMDKTILGSGELRINSQKQYSVVIYEDTYDIKSKYGNDKLYTEELKYSRDMSILVKNLERLELVAKDYAGSTKSSTYNGFYKRTWLVLYYIRRLKYADSTHYKVVTGSDSSFVTYVSSKASNLKTYFTNKNTFIVNGNEIDLKHMMASLSGNIYNTPWKYNLAYEEYEYDCLVSWAGDLHEFMQYNILKSGVKEKYDNYEKAVYSLLGNNSTRFSLEDIYADVDNWVIYYNLIENKNMTVGQAFDKYYSGESKRSYKNRFSSFITIMNSVGKSLGKTNFDGLVNHFTNVDKSWDTLGTLSITPTEAQEKEIAKGFISWIKFKAEDEK